jgi:hypothetical protein
MILRKSQALRRAVESTTFAFQIFLFGAVHDASSLAPEASVTVGGAAMQTSGGASRGACDSHANCSNRVVEARVDRKRSQAAHDAPMPCRIETLSVGLKPTNVFIYLSKLNRIYKILSLRVSL